MTIHNTAMNNRLTKLERCAEMAPEGSYVAAKEIAELVVDASNFVLRGLRALGHLADNSDRLRDLEAAIYGYIIDSNRNNDSFLIAAEGFGEHVDGPAGARVLGAAVKDRDFLRSIG